MLPVTNRRLPRWVLLVWLVAGALALAFLLGPPALGVLGSMPVADDY